MDDDPIVGRLMTADRQSGRSWRSVAGKLGKVRKRILNIESLIRAKLAEAERIAFLAQIEDEEESESAEVALPEEPTC